MNKKITITLLALLVTISFIVFKLFVEEQDFITPADGIITATTDLVDFIMA